MKLEVVKNAVTSKVARQVLVGKKHSPQIMFAAGVVGVGVTVVLACKATLNLEEVLNDSESSHRDIDALHQGKRQAKRDHAYVSVRTTAEIGRLYAPAVIVGCASIAALTGSHVTLTRRNVALTAAYKTLEEGFNRYRDRIKEEVGEEREVELYRNVQEREVHDTKGGKVKNEKYINPGGGKPSPYAVFYDQYNQNWKPLPEYNLAFLRAVQEYVNHLLKSRGHVFLNEVYDQMGFDHTKAGAVVGWIKNSGGDNYIDFGVLDPHQMDQFLDFINGDEGIWLDFNVDGTIYDKI